MKGILIFLILIKFSLSARNQTSNSILLLKCDQSNLENLVSSLCIISDQHIASGNYQIERNRKITSLTMKSVQSENLPVNLADSFPNLMQFSTSDSSFRIAKRDNFKNLRKLELLKMTRGELLRIRRDSFDDLDSVKIIDLSENLLSSLPVELFRQLEKLEELIVAGNEIEELYPRMFRNLPNLRIFNADENKIFMITADTFAGNRKLAKISLKNNALRFIDINAFSNLKELQSIDFSRNDCIDKEYSIEKLKGGFVGLLKEDVRKTCQMTVKY